MNKSNCKFCSAEIVWAKTWKGKMIPLDPKPTPGGKFGLILGGEVPTAVAAQDHHQLRYDSHFATCPYADRARRR